MEEEHGAVVVHRDSAAAVVVHRDYCGLAAFERVDCMGCSAAFVPAGDTDYCLELQIVVADTDFVKVAVVVGMDCEQLVGCKDCFEACFRDHQTQNTDWKQVVDKHSCLQIHHQTVTVDLDDYTDLIRMTSH